MYYPIPPYHTFVALYTDSLSPCFLNSFERHLDCSRICMLEYKLTPSSNGSLHAMRNRAIKI